MVTSIFIYIMGIFLSLVSLILPEWQVLPEKVFSGFQYFLDAFMGLNNIILVVPDIYEALTFLLRFFYWLGIFLIIRKVFNFFRGTGQGI